MMNESDNKNVENEEVVAEAAEEVSEESTEEVVAEAEEVSVESTEEVVAEAAEENTDVQEQDSSPVVSLNEKTPAQIVSDFESNQLKTDIPAFRPGDTIVVSVKVKEGDRTRLQAFEGVVWESKKGLNSSLLSKFQVV